MDISNSVTDKTRPSHGSAVPCAAATRAGISAGFAAFLALGPSDAEQTGAVAVNADETLAPASAGSGGKPAGNILPELAGTDSADDADTDRTAADPLEGEAAPADPALAVTTPPAAPRIEIVLAPFVPPAPAETGGPASPEDRPARSPARAVPGRAPAVPAGAAGPGRSAPLGPAGAQLLAAAMPRPDAAGPATPGEARGPAVPAAHVAFPASPGAGSLHAREASAAAIAAAQTTSVLQGRQIQSAPPFPANGGDASASDETRTDGAAAHGKPAGRQPPGAALPQREAELGADLSASRGTALALSRAGIAIARPAESLSDAPSTVMPAAPPALPSAQPAHPGATIPAAVPQPLAAHDFQAIVERLSEAREAALPQGFAAAISHHEFGRVSLSFRQDERTLAVAMSSSDPGFAPAVQAAAAAAAQQNLTGQDGSGASPRQESAPRHDPSGQGAASQQAGTGQGHTAGHSPSQGSAQGAARAESGPSGRHAGEHPGQGPRPGSGIANRADRRDIYA